MPLCGQKHSPKIMLLEIQKQNFTHQENFGMTSKTTGKEWIIFIHTLNQSAWNWERTETLPAVNWMLMEHCTLISPINQNAANVALLRKAASFNPEIGFKTLSMLDKLLSAVKLSINGHSRVKASHKAITQLKMRKEFQEELNQALSEWILSWTPTRQIQSTTTLSVFQATVPHNAREIHAQECEKDSLISVDWDFHWNEEWFLLSFYWNAIYSICDYIEEDKNLYIQSTDSMIFLV